MCDCPYCEVCPGVTCEFELEQGNDGSEPESIGTVYGAFNRCAHEGCQTIPYNWFVDDSDNVYYYCLEHATWHGFCRRCRVKYDRDLIDGCCPMCKMMGG